MTSLITRVRAKLFIHSARKSMHALDGAYASLMRGRSHDFEDLRAYEYGDQIRDIDWRATAKQGAPLVKRHRATRMHTVMFVVDTGRGMTALAHDEKPKKDLAILATGALGILSLRHGDDFTVVHGDASGIRRLAPARSEGALEHALRTIDRAIDTSTARSDRDGLLGYIARTISRRMILVLITDDAPITEETERILRRLRVQHDVLWIALHDADPVIDHASTRDRADVYTRWRVPDFVQGDEAIIQELLAQTAAENTRRDGLLDALEISRADLRTQDDAVNDLLRMLNRRANVRF